MLSMNSNKIIIDKHSSSIQISNKISTIQRKSYNYMLKIAKNEFQKDKNARVFTITADELLIFFGLGNKNHDYLRQELRKLRKIDVEYNLLNKDKKNEWGEFSLISGFSYKRGIIEYSFPHQIEKMLLNPKIFAKINLVAIKGLRSRYSIALYELAEDYINAQIPKMRIEEFRELMGIEEKKYYKFSMLRARVMDIAIKEINESENITFTVDYQLEKMGRKITHIKFNVQKKKDVLQLKESQKNFYGWKKKIVEEYKNQDLCNNLTELKYFKWVVFFINKNGYLGKDVDGNRSILEKEEAFKIWEFLYQNPSKIRFAEITHLDILVKDFRGKKIQQRVKTAFGTETTVLFEFLDFIEDKNREDAFFLKLKQEDKSIIVTQKSFGFYDILGMSFV